MLELLHIENIAIIDRADITFEPGFNALTGETGAGNGGHTAVKIDFQLTNDSKITDSELCQHSCLPV